MAGRRPLIDETSGVVVSLELVRRQRGLRRVEVPDVTSALVHYAAQFDAAIDGRTQTL
jgi:hypothetical protein